MNDKLDINKLKARYVELQLNDGSYVRVKLDDEGIVVDHFVDDEVQESTWDTYQELLDSSIREIDGRYTCVNCHREWSATLGDNEIPETCDCTK